MKRLILKLSTLVLLSVTYGAALSGNLTANASANPVKDATKTCLLYTSPSPRDCS